MEHTSQLPVQQLPVPRLNEEFLLALFQPESGSSCADTRRALVWLLLDLVHRRPQDEFALDVIRTALDLQGRLTQIELTAQIINLYTKAGCDHANIREQYSIHLNEAHRLRGRLSSFLGNMMECPGTEDTIN